MTSLRQTDVLVVGAGPTGLTLATLLRRRGVDVVIVDKASGPSTTSKALGLQYRVSELLAWMGLAERFLARAVTQSTVNILADGRTVARLALGGLAQDSEGFVPRALILPQRDTEALLGAALAEAGGTVEWSREMIAIEPIEPGAERVVALLAGGQRVAARYLVSCEGAHSLTRKYAGIDFSGKTYPHDFIMADVVMDTPLVHDQGYSWLHADGTLSAMPLPEPRTWRLFIEAGKAADAEVTLELVRTLLAARGDRASRIVSASWLTRFKIHSRMVARFSRGRLFLAGDAAHVHSPAGGQGITTGMQDAYNLAWKLAQVLHHDAPAALLDSYHEERRRVARDVLAATDDNTAILFPTTRTGKWLRNHVLMPLFGTRPVQRHVLRKLSQLAQHHRDSSLSLDAVRGWQRGLRAGDRAPDVRLDGPAGPTTLFAQLAGLRPVAWVTPDPRRPGSLARATSLVDELAARGLSSHLVAVGEPGSALARRYGVRGEGVVIIRPDGYVGLVCRPLDEAIVRAYVARLCGPARTAAAALAAAA
jgi:2-polyprenyl-6-methoxyphenol hydroxylase-like FAD-dependent oxidoreductase